MVDEIVHAPCEMLGCDVCLPNDVDEAVYSAWETELRFALARWNLPRVATNTFDVDGEITARRADGAILAIGRLTMPTGEVVVFLIPWTRPDLELAWLTLPGVASDWGGSRPTI